MRFSPSLVLGLALFATTATAHVIVVDPAGGGDFTQIQPAIDSASDGDTVLVRAGDYQYQAFPLTITGKGITLVADVEGTVIDPLTLDGIPVTSRVVVRGFTLAQALFPQMPGLIVTNAAGAVWLEDLQSTGAAGYGYWGCGSTPGEAGASISTSDSVTLVRCTTRGGLGADEFIGGPVGSSSASDGGAGLIVTDSRVSLDGCLLIGAHGGSGDFCSPAGNGGDGVLVTASTVLLRGSDARGGHGGETLGNGGNGLVLDATASVESLDSLFTGGGPGSQGQPGSDLVDPAGRLTTYLGQARWLTLPTPLREGQSTTLSFDGVPGDTVILYWSPFPQQLPFPQGKGWLLLGFPINGPLLTAVITSPSGQLDISLVIPELPSASLEGITVHMQAFFIQAGDLTIGSATGPVVLDASF